MFDYPARRARLAAELDAAGADAVFLPVSADLEYLTGMRRGIPSFGEVHQAHDWANGCFLRPGRDPLFILTRMHRTSGKLPFARW